MKHAREMTVKAAAVSEKAAQAAETGDRAAAVMVTAENAGKINSAGI